MIKIKEKTDFLTELNSGFPGNHRDMGCFFQVSLLFLLFCLPAIAYGDPPSANESIRRGNLLKLAEAGNPEAQFKLGMLYISAEGENNDLVAGVKWFQQAARNGHPLGQTSFAYAYFTGAGIGADDHAAFFWLNQAVKKERLFAPYFLGIMYDTGRGVEMNASEAFHWYLQSALHGHYFALGALANIYETGSGPTKDLVEAHALYELATEIMKKLENKNLPFYHSGEIKHLRRIALRRRAMIAKELSPEALREAQQRKKIWEQKLYLLKKKGE